MSKKYRIVKLPSNICETHFYGADVGDIIQTSNICDDEGGVWCIGSDVFKEDGWQRLEHYCVSRELTSFLNFVEEVV
jgi:hypothetical protein